MDNHNLKLITLLQKAMMDAVSKKHGKAKGKDEICKAMVTRLRFSDEKDWIMLGSCIYTYKDALMAIRGYFDTIYDQSSDDIQYLRLFGFLNAVYLQYKSISKLSSIINIDGDIIERIRTHKLQELRHMLAAHTLEYMKGDEVFSITIQQVSVGGAYVTYMINETDEIEKIDFRPIYESWVKETNRAISKIIDKFIDHAFETDSKRKSHFLAELNELKK